MDQKSIKSAFALLIILGLLKETRADDSIFNLGGGSVGAVIFVIMIVACGCWCKRKCGGTRETPTRRAGLFSDPGRERAERQAAAQMELNEEVARRQDEYARNEIIRSNQPGMFSAT